LAGTAKNASLLCVGKIVIVARATRVEIALRGAELSRLELPDLGSVLWPAVDPWPATMPLLFPVIGRSDRLCEGATQAMPLHGFAEDADFTLADAGPSYCRLVLTESVRSLEFFPYRFQLELVYSVHDGRLEITLTVSNSGDRNLQFDLGLHPGFRWPLVPRTAKEAHVIRFDDAPEQPPVAIRQARFAPGVATGVPQVDTLRLREIWFAEGAVAYAGLGDRAVRFGPIGGPALELRPRNFGCLAFWSRVGADFLCIEPWSGLPTGAASGSRLLPPGAAATFGLTIGVVEDD
jgi:galactose mutarotase-like enzyme